MTEDELAKIERIWKSGWGGWNGPEEPDILGLIDHVRLLRKLLNAYPCCSVHDMDEGHTEDCPVGKARQVAPTRRQCKAPWLLNHSLT